MRGLTRYVLIQLTWMMAFVTFGLVGVVWLSQSLRFIDLIVNRGLSFLTFFYLTVLLVPTFLVVILPIALFCAVVYTYHRLTAESEIVVMRAAGLSNLALVRPALILAGLTAAVCYAITLYLMPAGFGTFKERQAALRSDFSHLLLQEGTFNALAKGLTVYVRARRPNGEITGILVHDARDPARPVTMMAQNGALVSTTAGPRLVLVNGARQELEENGRRLGILYFDEYGIDLSTIGTAATKRWREPRERFLPELFHPSNSPDDQNNVARLIAAGHKRLVSPLYALVFALIGAAAMLAGEFDRRGRLGRVIVGAVVAVVFQALAIATANLAVVSLAAVPLMYLNVALMGGIALVVLGRYRGPARPLRLARMLTGSA